MEISRDPENTGEKLTSPLSNIYSHHIKYTGKEFRIAYTIDSANITVIVHLIAAHENFYRRLKTLMDNR